MASIRDVASLAGVSVGAVSRVLSQDPTLRIGDDARQRVIDAAASLQYVPSHAAQSLRKSRASALALVLPEVASPLVADMIRRVEETTSARGVDLLLAGAGHLLADPNWLRSLVASGRVDGVILQPPHEITPEEIFEMTGPSMRIVLINSTDTGALNTVVLDDAASARPAIEHLRELGHRRLGFVGGTSDHVVGQRRRDGFLAAAADAGMEVLPEHVLEFGFTTADGRRAAQHLVAGSSMPTALLVANANAAIGVLSEFHTQGVRVPEDISIVTLHDLWFADVTWPPLTTVRTPLAELGEAAVAIVLDRDPEHGVVHQVVTEPAFELVARASTAPPRTD